MSDHESQIEREHRARDERARAIGKKTGLYDRFGDRINKKNERKYPDHKDETIAEYHDRMKTHDRDPDSYR